jgi:hypothetical protein
MTSRVMKLGPKRRGASRPTESAERSVSESANENAIALLAYRLWQDRGSPIGSHQDDWFQAESELQARARSQKA